MKYQINLEIKPFDVPSCVFAEHPGSDERDNIAIPLSKLDGYDLESLCEKFTSEVFKKAGKQRPPKDIQGQP